MDGVIWKALGDADVVLDDVTGVAVTVRPGLIGALLVGVSAAKGLAYARRLALAPAAPPEGPGVMGALLVCVSAAKGLASARRLPLTPVDHLEGHVAAAYLAEPDLETPFVALIASGGHPALYR